MGGSGEAERNADEEKTGGVLKSVFAGGAGRLVKRPKTVGLMQDVFAADGDMAQVPAP